MSNFVPLAEIAEINPRPPRDIDVFQEVSFLPMAAVSEDGYVAFEEKRILSDVKKGFTYFERGDFLIAKITPCFENGKAALTCDIERPIGYGSTEFHVVRAMPSKLDKRYLYHLLWSKQFRFFGKNRMRGAAGQKRVSADFIKRYRIPLPPLEEQKHIAAILDKADAIRRKRQQAIELTDQLLRSVFLDMFGDPVMNPKGWEIATLSKIVDSLEGGKNVKPADSGKPTLNRILKVSAVTSGVFRPDESKPLPDDFEPPKSYFVKKGDLLISRANTAELIGATGFVYETPANIVLPDKIWRIKWKNSESVHPLYIHYLFKQACIRREVTIRSSGTSGSMKNIPKPKLLEISIPIPPVGEQNKFGAIVEKTNEIITRFGDHGNKIGDLFKSLSQRAFHGELTKQTKAA